MEAASAVSFVVEGERATVMVSFAAFQDSERNLGSFGFSIAVRWFFIFPVCVCVCMRVCQSSAYKTAQCLNSYRTPQWNSCTAWTPSDGGIKIWSPRWTTLTNTWDTRNQNLKVMFKPISSWCSLLLNPELNSTLKRRTLDLHQLQEHIYFVFIYLHVQHNSCTLRYCRVPMWRILRSSVD